MNPDNRSRAEKLASLPEPERSQVLADLAPSILEKQLLLYNWEFWARPKQLPPVDVEWTHWLILAGRGFGKTRSIAEWARLKAKTMPGSRGAIVSATAADARDIIVEGDSGILAVSPPTFRPLYEPSKRRLTWPNGSVGTLFTAEEPDRLRGPQHHWAICDELAAWRYMQEAWDMLMFGLRLGEHPQVAIATTPRPVPLIRSLIKDHESVIVSGSTYENKVNLAPSFVTKIIKKYEGTRLGRQELEAELLDDLPGALWTRKVLEDHRITKPPPIKRIVVAIDPAVTYHEDSNDTGIIVAGLGQNQQGYVLDDLTCQESPGVWAEKAILTFDKYKADRIIAEVNNGGDMVEHVIRTAAKDLFDRGLRPTYHIAYSAVRASRGKHTRAEPVGALYEQGRIHHVGMFANLEDQLCSWVPGEDSPDRLDALVWGFTELMLGGGDTAEQRDNEYW